MAHLDRVGIESDIVAFGMSEPPLARVRFRIDNSARKPDDQFPRGDWLDVRISARLYDPEEAAQGRLDVPLAEGPEERATARPEWAVIDLILPPVPPGKYGLAAKVFSGDDRYRQPFDPSNCRLGLIEILAPPHAP